MSANPRRQGHSNPIEALPDTLKIVNETHRQAEAVMESATETIKAAYSDPRKLADYIRNLDTPFYVLRAGMLSRFILGVLGFSAGFIPPAGHWRYRLLQWILRRIPNFLTAQSPVLPGKTPCFQHGVFVIVPVLSTMSFLSYQLHHWLAYRSGMRGYDEHAQKLYRQFWDEKKGYLDKDIEKMTARDILALKAAINRDMEALCFLRRIAQEVLIPSSQGQRLSRNGSASA